MSLFGSASTASGRSPTRKTRGLLAPHLLTTRTSWLPKGVPAGTVTLNLAEVGVFLPGLGFLVLGSMATTTGTASALMPGSLKTSLPASSRWKPATVTSTLVPALAPGGETT